MPEITEKKYQYSAYEITQSELDKVTEVALISGRSVDSVAHDLMAAKYPDIAAEDLDAMGLVAEVSWAENNQVDSYSWTQLSQQYREEHGIEQEDVQRHMDEWNDVRQGYKDGSYQIPISPENIIEKEPLPPAEDNKVSVSPSGDPNNPNINVTSNNKTDTVSPPSTSWRSAALQFVVDAGVSAASGLTKAKSAITNVANAAINEAKEMAATVKDNATDFLNNAVTTIGNTVDTVADSYNTFVDKASDWLAPKLNDAGAVMEQFPEAFKEVHDEMTDALADAMLVAADKGKRTFWDTVRNLKYLYNKGVDGGKQLDEWLTDKIADGLYNIKNAWFPDAVNIELDVILANAKVNRNHPQIGTWDTFWSNVKNKIDVDGLKDFYDKSLDLVNQSLLDYANKKAADDKADYTKNINSNNGKFADDFDTKKNNKINQKAAKGTDINNAIMDAISKYLPPKYRFVEHLQCIPHDIMKDACTKLEDELKNDSSHSLSTTDRERIMNIMWLSSGLGGYYNQLQTFMTSLNRFGGLNVTPASEHVGLTFITRPRLCLQSSNIRNNRIMTTLDTLNNTTMAFAIRCLLDSNFGNANDGLYRGYVATSPIFDQQNPFLVPLCNALTSFNGSPDIDIESTTTDGGYMSEAQTFAIGGSNLQRGNYNLTLNFQEVAHNPVLAILYYWIEYIRCVTRGSLMAYADDIDAQRLNYTVSIYRFLLDPTHRYITKYAKYTGCYPTGLPIGSAFNFSPGDVEVSASKNLSITFNCNKVEYMDYAILMDFNTLVRRYCPIINKGTKLVQKTRQIAHHNRVLEPRYRYQYNPITRQFAPTLTYEYVDRVTYETQQYIDKQDVDFVPSDDEGRVNEGYTLKCPSLPMEALTNFRGLPYIVSDRNGFRLDFRQHPSPAFNYQTETLADQLLYLDMIGRLSKEMANYETVTSLYTPDYYEKANAYKNVDLRDFIRRAFANTSSSDQLGPIQ